MRLRFVSRASAPDLFNDYGFVQVTMCLDMGIPVDQRFQWVWTPRKPRQRDTEPNMRVPAWHSRVPRTRGA
eukprot:8675323-Lingulodinium_polyedra.AAC.1